MASVIILLLHSWTTERMKLSFLSLFSLQLADDADSYLPLTEPAAEETGVVNGRKDKDIELKRVESPTHSQTHTSTV